MEMYQHWHPLFHSRENTLSTSDKWKESGEQSIIAFLRALPPNLLLEAVVEELRRRGLSSEALVEGLTPEQRKALAQRLREQSRSGPPE